MKKYGIIAIGILALAAIIICTIFIGRLTPQTVEGVKSALIEKGYYSDKHYKDLTLNGISTMANFGNGLNITLYDYGKKKDACDEMFDLMIETYKNDTRLTRKKHKNYTICEYSNETNYWIISRVDNTILLVIGAKEDADQTKEFAKGIGYYK
ncbi:MAG: hypothetical protein K5877_05905 [Lachnospiraceae bacterium]|nr:hypothetical protein [Lachnospiraceae bacterium]